MSAAEARVQAQQTVSLSPFLRAGGFTRVSHSTLRDAAEGAYTKRKKVDQYQLVEGLSTDETVVYVDPRTKQAIVALRGTARGQDILSDIGVAKGTLAKTARYKRTVQEVNRAKSQLAGYNVHLVGHSLGGSLAKQYSMDNPVVDTVSFNTGYKIPGQSFRSSRTQSSQRYREYLNSNDVVSAGSLFYKKEPGTVRYTNKRYFLGAHKARPTKFYE